MYLKYEDKWRNYIGICNNDHIVSLTKSLDANNFLDDCSGNILKNTTTRTYVTDAWF